MEKGVQSYSVEAEELCFRNCGMEKNSASSMWNSFRHVLPACLWQLWLGVVAYPGISAVAICLGQDSAASNKMLVAHIDNNSDGSGDRIFVIPAWCNQHGAGNCMQPVLERLQIVPPLYCLLRRLRIGPFSQRFHAGIKAYLRLHLKLITPQGHPNWAHVQ